MPLPASWTLVTVTGLYTNRDGSPAQGWVTFESRQIVTIGGELIVPKTITGVIDGSGYLSVQVPATDDPELSVTGWGYSVTEHLDNGGGRPPFLLEVPYTSDTLDLISAPHAVPRVTQSVMTPLQVADIGVTVADYDYTATGGVSRSVPAKLGDTLSVKDFGANGDGATDDTAAIQRAIDVALAAGGGTVLLPRGTYKLGPSIAGLTLWNAGASIASSTGCLLLRSGVRLKGEGIGVTRLVPAATSLTAIYVVDGTGSGVMDMEIAGLSPTVGDAHGIFSLLSANDDGTQITDVLLENLYVHDVASYGIGIQNGEVHGLTMQSIRVYNTGADGIDFKNRGTAQDSSGIFISDVVVDTFGRRLDGQAGIDVRGIVNASNVQVFNAGRSGATQVGVRFRTLDSAATESWGRRSTLHGFYVRSYSAADTAVTGISAGCEDVQVNGGVVENCYDGVVLTGNGNGNADNAGVMQVVVKGAGNRGFYAVSGVDNAKLVGCIAKSCLIGFRNEATNTTLVGCSAPASTTQLSASGGALPTQLTAGCDFDGDFVSLERDTTGRVAVRAKGTSTNIDLVLAPKGTSVVRFEYATAAATTPASFTADRILVIKDSSGTSYRIPCRASAW